MSWKHGVEIERVLTDNGREYCGRPLQHAFELYLAIQQIQHRRTDIGSPETNGFCERFHRTVKEEFYAVAFRKTFYESLDQLLRDLDRYLEFYNRERAHQGYRTQGRTPYQAFLDGIEAMQAQEAALAGTESGSATSPDGFDSSQKEVRPRPPRLRSAATGAHWCPPISS